ncbi:hypothetical protein WICMUC_003666 [Wickerhamomyces mucosus]|uniref:ABC1 atypical kinase-like domain-containing protein n=1 Tax=Wickerhamomyces mucosus TaxID=1378264 RepID=A0A9P8PLQ7_9ASCO|nr:hypothetical protein WICMUC_003666 [Wickerhamomyces mucosus]
MFVHERSMLRLIPSAGRYITRRYSTIPKPRSFYQENKNKILLSTLFGIPTILYIADEEFKENTKFVYHSFNRISTATIATIKCFINYKIVLSKNFENKEDYYNNLSKCHLNSANITLAALEKNGGIYIKLGQHISALTYLLPKEWTDTMIKLQDQCPKSDIVEINEMFQTDLNQSIEDIFQEFDPNPIGVASLAQVHIAKLKNGDQVAVKCQHPSLKEFVPLDVTLTKIIFKALGKFFPEYPLTWLSDELNSSIFAELDFNNEAENSRNTSKYFQNFQKLTALKIPDIIQASKRILIMEYVKGERLDNLQYLDDNHISRSEVSSCLSHIFNNMIFTPGVGIHCDPHGGNLAIRATESGSHNFEIILYDHGLYRHLSKQMRVDYSHFWLSLIDNDHEKMKYYAMKFSNIDENEFPLFTAAITGRDIQNAMNFKIDTTRSDKEIEVMKNSIAENDLLIKLMRILAKVPRVVLLILKTNDLTRHLDECLQNPLGLKRTFLILSNYCAKTVYQDGLEVASNETSIWKKFFLYFTNWWDYNKRTNQLFVYDFYQSIKNCISYI